MGETHITASGSHFGWAETSADWPDASARRFSTQATTTNAWSRRAWRDLTGGPGPRPRPPLLAQQFAHHSQRIPFAFPRLQCLDLCSSLTPWISPNRPCGTHQPHTRRVCGPFRLAHGHGPFQVVPCNTALFLARLLGRRWLRYSRSFGLRVWPCCRHRLRPHSLLVRLLERLSSARLAFRFGLALRALISIHNLDPWQKAARSSEPSSLESKSHEFQTLLQLRPSFHFVEPLRVTPRTPRLVLFPLSTVYTQ